MAIKAAKTAEGVAGHHKPDRRSARTDGKGERPAPIADFNMRCVLRHGSTGAETIELANVEGKETMGARRVAHCAVTMTPGAPRRE